MRMGALIVAGAIGFVLSILALGSRVEAQTSPKATGGQDASSNAAAAIASEAKNKNFDLSTISRAIADEASRLKNDAAGWVQKLQQLELDLNKTQQDDEAAARDLDESLVVLRAAAGRLGPDAEARATLRKEEAAVRELASRAEVHSQPEIRKAAGYFQQKTGELRAVTRSVEETRIQLITQIDRLEELKAQIEFRGGGQIGESIKRGQETLSGVQVIADNAQRLANDLNGFGRTPTAETTTPARATNAPAAAAKPADAINPMQGTNLPAAAAKPAAGTNSGQGAKRR
jgi:hypothetical protein